MNDRAGVRKTGRLRIFVREECANFHKGLCWGEIGCKVLEGKRCRYFEKSVLHRPDYSYPYKSFVDNRAFERVVRDEYASIAGGSATASRYCACGNPLRKRRRLCAKCRRKNRLKTQRLNQLKYRRKKRRSA